MIRILIRKFSRLATNAVVARPALWSVFRGPVRKIFDRLAPTWETGWSADAFAPLEAALDAVPGPVRRALDVGTGTGRAARMVAGRFDVAEVVGIDIAQEMLAEARRHTTDSRVRYERADASALPYSDASFDLVTLSNMIPFPAEIARVLRGGGHAVFAFTSGPQTPIYVPPEKLEAALREFGFTQFARFAAGHGTALLARKA